MNTDNQLTCLNGGTCSLSDSNLDINSLKTLRINTKVARNTEAVQLDIIESDNLNSLSSNSTSNTNTAGLNANTLALINNQTETRAKLNPNGDSRIKTNQYNRSYTLGSTTKTISNITTLREASLVNNTTNTICTQEECDWNYSYPFPSYLAGGQYELRIRTYKGDSIEEITKPFSIKGIINTNPSILRLEKKVLTNECSHINKTTDVYSVLLPTNMTGCKNTENSIAKENIVNSINNVTNQATTYYTNNKYIKLYIGSDPNLKLGYSINSTNGIGGVLTNSIIPLTPLTTNTTGIATLEYNLDKDINNNPALNSNGEGNFSISIGIISTDTTSPNYNKLIPTSITNYNLVVDRTAPILTSVTTSNLSNSKAINPWLRSGDKVGFSYNTNEPLLTSSVISEAGFRNVGNRSNTNSVMTTVDNTTTPSFCNYTELDYIANSSRVSNTCKSAFWNTTTSINTSLTILRDLEGLYSPSINLTDLAGNSSLYTNELKDINTNTLITNPIDSNLVSVYNGLKKDVVTNTTTNPVNGTATTTTKTNYDFDYLPYSKLNVIPAGINTANNYNFYSGVNRTPGLDFRLSIDNTLPKPVEFNLTNYNTDDGIKSDGITPEIDRLPTSGIRFITKGNKINLKTNLVEKNLRINLYTKKGLTTPANVNSSTPNGNSSNTSLVYDNNTVLGGSNSSSQINQTNCTTQTTNPSSTSPKTGLAGLITMDGINCNLDFDYNLNTTESTKTDFDNGISPSGEAYNYYDFSFNTLDLAGNTSLSEVDNAKIENRSTKDTCYGDTTNPTNPNNNLATNLFPTIKKDIYSNKSCSVLIYHDSNKPFDPSGLGTNPNNISSTQTIINKITDTTNLNPNNNNGGKELIDYYSSNTPSTLSTIPSTYPITNQTKINIQTSGEQKADVEYRLKDKNNNLVSINTNSITYKGDNTINTNNNTTVTNQANQTNNLTPENLSSNQLIINRNGNSDNPTNTTELPLGNVTNSSNVITNQNTKRDDDTTPATTNSPLNCNSTNNTTTTSSPITTTLGTIAPITNRRIGNCQDGLYQVLTRHIDTVGNRGDYVNKIIERDTVSPSAPTLNLTKYGNRVSGEKARLEVVGEGGGRATISVIATSGTNVLSTTNKSYTLNSNGQLTIANLVGNLLCGNITYTTKVFIRDRAGNTGSESTTNVVSSPCLTCSSIGTGQFINPVGNLGYISSDYGVPRGTDIHHGKDFAVATNQAPVMATDSGVIVDFGFGVTANTYGTVDRYAGYVNAGAGNFITISHGGGLYSTYMHMQNIPIAGLGIGVNVTKGQQIGYVGNTGNSEGAHLHFQVSKTSLNFRYLTHYNTYAINPNNYMNNVTGNLDNTKLEELEYCTILNTGSADGNSSSDIYTTLDPESLYYENENAFDTNAGEVTIKLDSSNNVISTNKTIKPNPITTYIDYNDPNSLSVYGKSIFGKGGENTNQRGMNIKLKVLKDIVTGQEPINCKDRENGLQFWTTPTRNCQQKDIIEQKEILNTTKELQADTVKVFIDKYNNSTNTREYDKAEVFLNNNPAITTPTIFNNPDGTPKTIQTNSNGRFNIPVTNSSFNKEDSMCVKTKINLSIPKADFSNDQSKVDKDIILSGNDLQLWGDCVSISNYVKDVDKEFSVKSNKSDSSKKEWFAGTNKDNLTAKLNILSDNVDNRSYAADKDVWIVSHGYSDNSGGNFTDIANAIKSKYGSSVIVMTLDWEKVAKGEAISWNTAIAGDICKVATYIKPTADVVTRKLKQWRLLNPSKIHLVGHSLGTLMSMEISRNYSSSVDSIIALDPPSEASCGVYNTQANPQVKRGDFRNFARFSRAINGNVSVGGNKGLANTANEAFYLDNEVTSDSGQQHVQVVSQFLGLITNNTLKDNLLDINHLNPEPFDSRSAGTPSLKGILRSAFTDLNRTHYLETVLSSNQRKTLIGTMGNGIFNLSSDTNQDVYGYQGEDTFRAYLQAGNSIIKDFSNDKISLPNNGFSGYTVVNDNGTPVLKYNSEIVSRIEGGIGSSDLEGDLARLKADKPDDKPKIFIKR